MIPSIVMPARKIHLFGFTDQVVRKPRTKKISAGISKSEVPIVASFPVQLASVPLIAALAADAKAEEDIPAHFASEIPLPLPSFLSAFSNENEEYLPFETLQPALAATHHFHHGHGDCSDIRNDPEPYLFEPEADMATFINDPSQFDWPHHE